MQIIEFLSANVNKMKQIQEAILTFLDKNQVQEADYQHLFKYFDSQGITGNKLEFKVLLHLIAKISTNHHRSTDFITRIERILQNYEAKMKSYFSNYELFIIFKADKRILLFLFNSRIIIPERTIASFISKEKYKRRHYPHYFYPEFKDIFDEKFKQELNSEVPALSESETESFQQKRKIGENDSEICRLIRNDLVDDFIRFVNQNNIQVYNDIEQSIFETNSYLIKGFCTSFEYAAFFGSIKIFKYLLKSGIEVDDMIWKFSIHGSNAELIHLIEECHVELTKYAFLESIKCHHIDIMNYIKNEINDSNAFYNCLNYYNFIELSDQIEKFDEKAEIQNFYNFCKYDFVDAVDFILKNSKIDINSKIIPN